MHFPSQGHQERCLLGTTFAIAMGLQRSPQGGAFCLHRWVCRISRFLGLQLAAFVTIPSLLCDWPEGW